MSSALSYFLPAALGVGGGMAGGPFGAAAGSTLGSAIGGGGAGAGPMSGLSNLINRGLSSLGMTGTPAAMASNPPMTPWTSLDPTQQAGINQALAASPSTAGLVGQVAGVNPIDTGGGSAGSTGDSDSLSSPNVGSIGQIYLQYLAAKRLAAQEQRTRWAPATQTPTSQMPGLLQLPSAAFQLPQLNV